MPIYEYKCEKGHAFDVTQRMADDPLTECVECGAPAVRVLHSPAVHFKGSGFYNTDYGKKSKSNGSSSEGSSESKSAGESKSAESSTSSDSSKSDKASASTASD